MSYQSWANRWQIWPLEGRNRWSSWYALRRWTVCPGDQDSRNLPFQSTSSKQIDSPLLRGIDALSIKVESLIRLLVGQFYKDHFSRIVILLWLVLCGNSQRISLVVHFTCMNWMCCSTVHNILGSIIIDANCPVGGGGFSLQVTKHLV